MHLSQLPMSRSLIYASRPSPVNIGLQEPCSAVGLVFFSTTRVGGLPWFPYCHWRPCHAGHLSEWIALNSIVLR